MHVTICTSDLVCVLMRCSAPTLLPFQYPSVHENSLTNIAHCTRFGGNSDPYCILSLVPPERFHGKGSFRFRAAAAKESFNQMVLRTLLRGKKAFWDAVTRVHRWWLDLFAKKDELISTKKRAASLSKAPSSEDEGHHPVMNKIGAPLGSYSRTRSKTLKKTLNPEWMEDLELYLEGGHLDAQGNLFNRSFLLVSGFGFSRGASASKHARRGIFPN